MRRFLFPPLALLALAAAAPPRMVSIESGGSIAQAAQAFRNICLAHPGSAAGQRAAALTARPRPFKAPPVPGPRGVDSLVAWPVQLAMLDADGAQVCAILSPLLEAPDPSAALAEVRTELRLGPPTAMQQRDILWHRTSKGLRQTIAFAIAAQPDALGATRPTVRLTLSSAKVR